ncbi:MAG: 16S rRNA (adenine(1518)-N(6)/adenine(1519)-N(6))-dimethyltransferase RsmA [Gammaproteobacteria bacterium]|mgnify:CR=1 FL=1|nr:MAG: 16S rRNA (adenine(1518)-N(6)/adenine(1519)-N(6))-dimethyltransferase RsmA [Gammaproteobacteria bacterium]
MNHKHKKRFGQNFLHDNNVINKIVSSITPKEGEELIEIGPGQGAITMPLLTKAKKLTAVEIDTSLIEPLQQKAADIGELKIVQADALTVNLAELATSEDKLRIFGNLPYNISTPLIFHFLKFRHHIADMHFMLQKEVVDRIAAPPGNKTYGRLSVMTQYYCKAEHLFDIGRNSFYPPPKVESSFVRLIPFAREHKANDEELFANIVLHAFNQRRKTIRNSLSRLLTAEQIESCNISPTARPETLSVEEFIRLANFSSK